MIINDFAWIDK